MLPVRRLPPPPDTDAARRGCAVGGAALPAPHRNSLGAWGARASGPGGSMPAHSQGHPAWLDTATAPCHRHSPAAAPGAGAEPQRGARRCSASPAPALRSRSHRGQVEGDATSTAPCPGQPHCSAAGPLRAQCSEGGPSTGAVARRERRRHAALCPVPPRSLAQCYLLLSIY